MSFYSELMNTSQATFDVVYINDLEISGDITIEKADENAILVTDADKKIISKSLNDGQLLIGKTGYEPQAATITGTTKQVNVTNGAGSITLSLPQDIDVSSNPIFNSLTLSGNLTANGIDCASIISTGDIKSNTNIVGNQLIGTNMTSNRLVGVGTGGLLQSLTASSNNGMVTTVSGTSLIIDTPQDLQTTAHPVFDVSDNLTCGYVAGDLVPSANLSYSLGRDNGDGSYRRWQFIYVGGLNCNSVRNHLLPYPNNTYDIGSSSFKWKNIYATNLNVNTAIINGLTPNRLIGCDSSGALQTLTATSSNGVSTTVTGTTLTINTPQDLRTNSNPTFNNLHVNTVSGLKLNLLESSSQITMGNSSEGYTIIKSLSGGAGTTYTYTIPTTVATNAYFVMSEGNEVINGHKSFSRISTTNVSSNLIPFTTATYDIGSTSNRWPIYI